MKIAFTSILLTALVLQRACALPQHLDIGQMFGSIIHTPRLAFEKFEEYARTGFESAQKFANQVRTETKNLFKKVQTVASQLNGRFQYIIAKNTNRFWRIFNPNSDDNADTMGNKVNLKSLKKYKQKLESLLSELESLQILANNIRSSIKEDTSKYEEYLQTEWNAFATEQLARVAKETENSEKLQRIEQLINSLVNRFGNYINACVEEYELTGRKFQENIKSLTEKHQSYIEDLLDKVDDCFTTDTRNKYNKECEENLETGLHKLADVPNILNKFEKEGKDILGNGFDKRTCVLSTLAEFESEKQQSIQKLRTIIDEK